MEQAITSAKSLDSLLGKVLVAKCNGHEMPWAMVRLGEKAWQDIPIGTILYVLTENRSYHNISLTFMYNGIRGSISYSQGLDKYFGVVSPDDRLKGKAIVFTGALTNTRDYYKTLVEVFGGVFGSAVTGKTAYLVSGDKTFQGDKNHQSTKAKKAKALGVPVLDEQGFYDLINKG